MPSSASPEEQLAEAGIDAEHIVAVARKLVTTAAAVPWRGDGR